MSNDPLLNVSQAARLLGVSRGTLYNWVYEGRIDHVKLGPDARHAWTLPGEIATSKLSMLASLNRPHAGSWVTTARGWPQRRVAA